MPAEEVKEIKRRVPAGKEESKKDGQVNGQAMVNTEAAIPGAEEVAREESVVQPGGVVAQSGNKDEAKGHVAETVIVPDGQETEAAEIERHRAVAGLPQAKIPGEGLDGGTGSDALVGQPSQAAPLLSQQLELPLASNRDLGQMREKVIN